MKNPPKDHRQIILGQTYTDPASGFTGTAVARLEIFEGDHEVILQKSEFFRERDLVPVTRIPRRKVAPLPNYNSRKKKSRQASAG